MLNTFPSPQVLAGLLTVSLLYAPTLASEYALHQGSLRLTYDPVTIESNESLGLLGFHALIRQGEFTYFGISGYGAVNGERGGFLAGGYSAGLHVPLDERFSANVSLFLGGGGGGAAPQGGGLMVREQAGIDYSTSGYEVGIGISHIRFPNGEIDSVQPYLSLQLPFTALYAPGWESGELFPGNFSQPLYGRESSFALSSKRYTGNALFRSGIQHTSTFSTIGAEWQQHVGRGFYYGLSTHGAYDGGADGYAEVMAIGGTYWKLTQDTAFGVGMALGSGGGGNVDTGGGVLGAVTLNLEQKLPHQLFLSLQGGRTGAMDGQFGGTVVGIVFGTHHASPVTTGWQSEIVTNSFRPVRYRLGLIQQRYLPDTALRNSHLSTGSVDLTGIQIDRHMADHVYLTGQAMAAWRGEAGGYASGMMGGGLSLPFSPRLELHGELLAGAAGGGGIDVGDGLLLGGTISAIAHLSKSLDLQVGTGRIAAYDGGLDTRQVTLAIAYRLTHPEK